MTGTHHEKRAPGHHVQAGVSAPWYTNDDGLTIEHFWCTVVDDATRVSDAQNLETHAQNNSVDSADHVVGRL